MSNSTANGDNLKKKAPTATVIGGKRKGTEGKGNRSLFLGVLLLIATIFILSKIIGITDNGRKSGVWTVIEKGGYVRYEAELDSARIYYIDLMGPLRNRRVLIDAPLQVTYQYSRTPEFNNSDMSDPNRYKKDLNFFSSSDDGFYLKPNNNGFFVINIKKQ